MMDRSERLGLGVSTAGHVLLFGALSLGLLTTSVTLPPPPATIDVSLADSIALESRTTEPAAETATSAVAPEVGETEPDAAPPEPVEAAPAPLAPPPRPAAPERPSATQPAPPKPRETPRPTPPKATPKEQQKPAPAKAEAKPQEKPRPQRASRLGSDFLKGLESDAPPSRNAPATSGSAAPMGAVAARALNAEINRQIKPHWRPPSGADADRLVTLLSVHLDRNGAVVGRIEVVGQQGITASNRAQADLHAERAIQAVMRASPFRNLPPEYYDQWKWLQPLRFDARLSQ
ncbi:putative TolA [Sphingobium sp. SYK-6]|uniref:TonB C-terminal domain-containing protein n=1 Tax=Sphingobium sp. (strain NBRC 103272 / SYK-6) TaxID=627192 RepID=UPI0002276CC3|nr:putative TolA [Sphingobium sp. SYK-6]